MLDEDCLRSIKGCPHHYLSHLHPHDGTCSNTHPHMQPTHTYTLWIAPSAASVGLCIHKRKTYCATLHLWQVSSFQRWINGLLFEAALQSDHSAMRERKWEREREVMREKENEKEMREVGKWGVSKGWRMNREMHSGWFVTWLPSINLP